MDSVISLVLNLNHNYYRNDLNYSQFAIDGTIIPAGSVTGLVGDWTVFAVIGVDYGSSTAWTWNTAYSYAGPANASAGYLGLSNVYTVEASLDSPRLIIKEMTLQLTSCLHGVQKMAEQLHEVTTTSTPIDFSDYLGFLRGQ